MLENYYSNELYIIDQFCHFFIQTTDFLRKGLSAGIGVLSSLTYAIINQ